MPEKIDIEDYNEIITKILGLKYSYIEVVDKNCKIIFKSNPYIELEKIKPDILSANIWKMYT